MRKLTTNRGNWKSVETLKLARAIDEHVKDDDNPHSVSFSQTIAADAGTDVTPAEMETLTDGSNADTLHTHDHDALINFVAAEHIDWSVTGAEDIHDDRIALSSVSQHQSSLTVAESQITDGALLARLAADETVTGAWLFEHPTTHSYFNLRKSAATRQAAVKLDSETGNTRFIFGLDATSTDNFFIGHYDESGVWIGSAMTVNGASGFVSFPNNVWFNVNLTVQGTLYADTIVEETGATGVTVDGLLIKDGDATALLNEARHDALAADNPHSVTLTQAVAADAGTDVTAAELETLTDGGAIVNSDGLHVHGLEVSETNTGTVTLSDEHMGTVLLVNSSATADMNIQIGNSDTTFENGAVCYLYNLNTTYHINLTLLSGIALYYQLKNGNYSSGSLFSGDLVLPPGSYTVLYRYNAGSWYVVTQEKTTITPQHDLVFEGTLSSSTLDTNSATNVNLTWNDAEEHADITHTDGDAVISFDVAGEYDIYFNAEVTTASGTNRNIWGCWLDHLDSSSVSIFEYTLGVAYTRASWSPNSSVSGHFNLVVGTDEKIRLHVKMLDRDQTATNYLDTTESYLRVMRKTYEV